MANRIYTQADYDKVTDLYNEYQNKKDSYTPEQQQKIEAAFWNAWTSVSNKIEESKNMIADMWNDDQWNTRAMYWNWNKEIINYAPQSVVQRQAPRVNPRHTSNPNPNPTPEQAIQIPEWYTQEEIDKYWLIWPQEEPIQTTHNTVVDPRQSPNYDPSKPFWKQDYYSTYMQMKWTWYPSTEMAKWFRWSFWEANSTNSSLVRNHLKSLWYSNQQINDFITDWARWTLQTQEQSKLNSPYRIQTKWNDWSWYNNIQWADKARENLINKYWYTVWENWMLYRPDWTPLLWA